MGKGHSIIVVLLLATHIVTGSTHTNEIAMFNTNVYPVAQSNPLSITLTGIVLRVSAEISFNSVITNTSSFNGNYVGDLYSGRSVLAPGSGVPFSPYEYLGSDSISVPAGGSATFSLFSSGLGMSWDVVIPPADWHHYLGASTTMVSVIVAGHLNITGDQPFTAGASSFSTTGAVSIIYQVDNSFLLHVPYIAVNYAEEWISGATSNSGEKVTLYVYNSESNLVDSAGVESDADGRFVTSLKDWETGELPRIEPGSVVQAFIDGQLAAEINPVGSVAGAFYPDSDTVDCRLNAAWLPDPAGIVCEVWDDSSPASINGTIDPDNGWMTFDFGATGYDLTTSATLAVRYYEPDGDSVINIMKPPPRSEYIIVNGSTTDVMFVNLFWDEIYAVDCTTNLLGGSEGWTELDQFTPGGDSLLWRRISPMTNRMEMFRLRME